MCLIRRSMGDDLHDGEWPMAEGRLRAAISAEYPYRFITRASVRLRIPTFEHVGTTKCHLVQEGSVLAICLCWELFLLTLAGSLNLRHKFVAHFVASLQLRIIDRQEVQDFLAIPCCGVMGL